MASTAGPKPGPFSIASLIRNKDNCYEHRVSDLLAARNEAALRVPGAFYLPDQTWTRDLGIGTPTSGGNLVGAGMAEVLAATRPTLLLERIGAPRLTVSNVGIVDVPVWDAANVGAWIGEGASAPTTALPVKSCTATGHMAAARVALSRRMALQAEGIEAAVLGELEAAVAGLIEPALINGTGSSNQPLGLMGAIGKQTQSFAGANPTFSELIDQIELYALADGPLERAVWLLNPATAANLMKTQIVATDAQMLAVVSGPQRQPLVCGIPAFTSRHVPANKVVLLDPTMLRLVYFGSPQLVIDRFSNGKSINGGVELHLFNLVDLIITRPNHIVVGSN